MAAIARTGLLRGRYRCCGGNGFGWWQSLSRQCDAQSFARCPGTCPLAGLGVTWRSMDQAGVASGIHLGGVVRHETRVVVMVDRQQRAL